MLENTEGAIKNGQSRETGNLGCTKRRKTKQKHNTIYVGHHYRYAQTNTNNVNKTSALLQTTWGKRRTEHRFYAEIWYTTKKIFRMLQSFKHFGKEVCWALRWTCDITFMVWILVQIKYPMKIK
jgi:hypothetical protein